MTCFVCGKEGAEANQEPCGWYHYACVKCSNCGADDSFIWKRGGKHSKPPMIRCLECGDIGLYLDGKWV